MIYKIINIILLSSLWLSTGLLNEIDIELNDIVNNTFNNSEDIDYINNKNGDIYNYTGVNITRKIIFKPQHKRIYM